MRPGHDRGVEGSPARPSAAEPCATPSGYVEADLRGHETIGWLKGIAIHLRHCPAPCADHDGGVAPRSDMACKIELITPSVSDVDRAPVF